MENNISTPVYQVFKICSKNVLVTSTDYYRRSGDFQEETIQTLEFIDSFDNEQLAVKYLTDFKDRTIEDPSSLKYLKGNYTILPIYEIK